MRGSPTDIGHRTDQIEIAYNKFGHIRYCPKAELFAGHDSEYAFPDAE